MEFLKIILTSISSLVVLFILTKLMGNKQMSQLNMFDYIISISIGSIAAEMAIHLEEDFWYALIAMLIYGIVAYFISVITAKSLVIRRFLNGKSLILLDNGVLYKDNFKRARVELSEFMATARENGFYNIADIQIAVMESSGKISFLPKNYARPVNPGDLNLSLEENLPVMSVILDGKILYGNLKYAGQNESWLLKKLKQQKISLEQVFLATCDFNGNLSIYTSNNEKQNMDIFE